MHDKYNDALIQVIEMHSPHDKNKIKRKKSSEHVICICCNLLCSLSFKPCSQNMTKDTDGNNKNKIKTNYQIKFLF